VIDLDHLIELDLVNRIGRLVIIFMVAGEKENNRYVMLCKVVVIAAPVILFRVVLVVVLFINVDFFRFFIRGTQQTVKLRADLIRADDVHIIQRRAILM